MLLSGLRWLLSTVADAASAEVDDGMTLREALLDAEERHRRGEISGAQFAEIEDALLSRMSEMLNADEAEAGPIVLARTSPRDRGESLDVEASVLGDFHEPSLQSARREPRPRARVGHARRKT